jgi:beta-1,2-mannobiose phosphorylase / 1,2-beta-oligomannan phosphorylase
MLLDLNDPSIIRSRTDLPVFEPKEQYELYGQVPNVVFPCGAVVVNGIIFIYYGGADSVTGVATMPLSALLHMLEN